MTGHRRVGFLGAKTLAAGISLGADGVRSSLITPQELEVWMAGTYGR